MSVSIKIVKQTFWQILGKVVSSASTIIILGLVTRNYGEAGTGNFTLALSFLAIFYLLTDFGFNAHVLTNLKSQNSKLKTIFQNLLGTRIIWSASLIVFAILLLPFLPSVSLDFSTSILIGSPAIMFSAIFISCNLIFQSRLSYNLSVLAYSTGAILSLVISVYLILFKYPIYSLFLAQVIGYFMTATVSLLLVKRILPKITARFNKQYAADLFRESWPIAATLSLNVIYFRADSFMIAYFKTAADVGIYNLAYQVFQALLVLPTFIMNAYYPLMLQSLKEVKLVAVSLLVLASVITVLLIIFAPMIVYFLTGGGFAGSAKSLQILALGFPAYFVSAMLMWLIVSKGKYHKLLIIYALGLVVNLTLNFIFIPGYSYLAASYVTIISEYLILLMQLIILKK